MSQPNSSKLCTTGSKSKEKSSQKPNKNVSSFSILLHLPEDPSQLVLSYLNLHNMLQLSLVSVHLRDLVSSSHSLFLPENKDAIQNSNRLATQQNVDSALSCTPGPQHYHHSQSSIPTSSSSSSTRLAATTTMSLLQISTLTSLQQLNCLLVRFQNLRHLTLHKLNLLGDKFLSFFNKYPSTPQLITLQLHHVRILPHQMMKRGNESSHYQIHLHNLQHLAISGTIFYPEIATILTSFTTKLKNIQLSGFRTASDTYLSKFLSQNSNESNNDNNERMSMLTDLQLRDFTQIKNPRIAFSSVVRLDLSHSGIQSLSQIACPNLMELNLSSCSNLTDEAIQSFLNERMTIDYPSRLEILKLKGCCRLNYLYLRSKTLKSLDLTLCPRLTSLEVESENLSHLQVETCLHLQSLILHPTNHLENLDLSLLPRLQRISLLNTPSLYSLDLSGCSELTFDGVQLVNNEKLAYVNICGTCIRVRDNDSELGLRVSVYDKGREGGNDISRDFWGHECVVVNERGN